MKPSVKQLVRSKAVAKGAGTAAKYRDVSRPTRTVRRRHLHSKFSWQRTQDALKRLKQDPKVLEAVSVDPAFEASMMARLEQVAAKDTIIAASLLMAKEDPAALLIATENDPSIAKSLAVCFSQEIANDPTTAIEFAKILLATALAPAHSEEKNESRLVTSDSDNDSSLEEESLG